MHRHPKQPGSKPQDITEPQTPHMPKAQRPKLPSMPEPNKDQSPYRTQNTGTPPTYPFHNPIHLSMNTPCPTAEATRDTTGGTQQQAPTDHAITSRWNLNAAT